MLDAKLHYCSATFYEGDRLRTLSEFNDSQREGATRIWNESRQLVVFAQFHRNELDGLACLFHQGKPVYIQEWQSGSLADEYQVRWNVDKPTVIPKAAMAPDQAKEAAVDRERLAALLAELLAADAPLKRVVRDWYRDALEQYRQKRAAAYGAAARRQIIGRSNARRAANDAALGGMMQGALRRSGL